MEESSTPVFAPDHTHTHGDCTVVPLRGEIDLLTAPDLTRFLDSLTAGRHPDLLIDLRQVEFLDGSGITTLVRARSRAVAREGRVRLLCTHPPLLRVLRLPELRLDFDVLEHMPAPEPAT
ncbi:STAS domain-containing protein [Streptomyces sp. SPB162]|uniref:STAS domain-containing protein n=1 Tax=Streptomyces sp. SPB162 TaxID=2940560 RepID=UPI00240708F8|nr:STAS domain-containing protein [Streptomyces sp. SPB162]MDF9811177.1 anti-sigma B factor antagonist [Streptomyces sp. SPB162]